MVNWVLLMQILLCLYFLQIPYFLVTVVTFLARRGNKALFSGNLSTGPDLVINFDFTCITKININSYPYYNGKLEGELSPER